MFRIMVLAIAVLCIGSSAFAQPGSDGGGGSSCSSMGYTSGSWNGNMMVANTYYEYSGQQIAAKAGVLGNTLATCVKGTPQGDGSCYKADIGYAQAAGWKVTFSAGTFTSRHNFFWGAGLGLYTYYEYDFTCPTQPPCGGDPGCSNSPILVPTKKLLKEGRGAEVGGTDHLVFFDIDGDGVPEQVTWPKEGTAFLAIDINNNGIIDDGTEMFGTAGNYASGFDKLTQMSGSTRGYLDDGDPFFDRLLLWHDSNRDGQTQSNELKKLKNYIIKIGLGYELVPDVDEHGNQFRWKGWAEYKLQGAPAPNPHDINRDMYPLYDVNFVRVP